MGDLPFSGVIIICTTLVLPFAFVIVMVYLKMLARNRQFDQLMQERKLMIERGLEPPPLELPEDEPRQTGPRLENLKAGIVLLTIAAALFASNLIGAEVHSRPTATFATPVAVIAATLGVGLLVLHCIVRRLETQAEQEAQPEEAVEESE